MTDAFVQNFNHMQEQVHATAINKGWHDKPREDGTIIALIHEELSEGLRALRKGNIQDDKIPEFLGIEAELADVIIRIMDYAELKGLRVAEAIVAKAEMNKGRSYRHGNKAF